MEAIQRHSYDASQVRVMGIDAGGTMTDTFFVRADGRFVVGKSQSNPDDESFAILESSADALSLWGRQIDEVYPHLVTCVYSGTAMLNRVVPFSPRLIRLAPAAWVGSDAFFRCAHTRYAAAAAKPSSASAPSRIDGA